MMAGWGFSGQAIQTHCLRYDGEYYSTGHIYSTVRKLGLRIKDYRDGESPEAKRNLKKIFAGDRPVTKVVRPRPKRRQVQKAH